MQMEVERVVKEIPIDSNFQEAINQLQQDGWKIDPEVTPKAIYFLIRPVTVPDMQLKLAIDESKITVIRNGKVVG
jgi:hypothetical protein